MCKADTPAMKTIVLTAVNARYSHSNPAVYYLKTFISDMDYDVRIQNFSINRPPDEIAHEIAEGKPDIAGFSVYIWNAATVHMLLEIFHEKCPDTVIVLGGPEVSGDPEAWLQRHPEVDYIVSGPGEHGFRHLLENNLEFRDKIVRMPNPPFAEIPFPYSEEDMPQLRNRYIYYESSRGCPFRCTYCLSSRRDQAPDYRPVETVKRELDQLIIHSPDYIKFVDRTFNSNRGHYQEIWRYIIEKHGSASTVFHFELFPSSLNETDYKILASCPKGLFQLEIGIQSVNPETLRSVQRTGGWEETETAVKRLVSMGLFHLHVDMIIGLPGEGMDEIARSFNSIYELRADHFQVGFLKILKGTAMAENAEGYGMEYPDTPPYQITENRWLSQDDMYLLRGIADLVETLYNRGRFITALENLEELFQTPFDLYRSLVPPCLPGGHEHISMTPEKKAALLLDLAEKMDPSRVSFIRDCLRWDWCMKSGSRHVPPLLRTGTEAETKKKAFAFFSRKSKQGTVSWMGHDFTIRDIRSAPLFRADTEKFRSIYMQGHSTSIFLAEGNIVFLSP